MLKDNYSIFLADDDQDDTQFLIDAFKELPQAVTVTTFDNGVELMDTLWKSDQLPHMIFLDLFMPMMNGEECLADIRNETKLSKIPVVIYSTMLDMQKAEILHQKGANLYLRKPSSFEALKDALTQCIRYIDEGGNTARGMADFIIQY